MSSRLLKKLSLIYPVIGLPQDESPVGFGQTGVFFSHMRLRCIQTYMTIKLRATNLYIRYFPCYPSPVTEVLYIDTSNT